jgi:flagellar biosynthetic protein FliR
MLLFFTSNAHLAIIRLFIDSQKIIPYGEITFNRLLSSAILTIFCDCTILAFKFAMPIFAAEFLTEMGVGILMKTIPQINVFVVNIQMKVLLGLILLFILFTPMSQFVENIIELMFGSIQEIMSLM